MGKLRILREIAGNIRWVFSFGFWKGGLHGDLGPVWAVIVLVFFTAGMDIFRMMFVPGYPDKTAR